MIQLNNFITYPPSKLMGVLYFPCFLQLKHVKTQVFYKKQSILY